MNFFTAPPSVVSNTQDSSPTQTRKLLTGIIFLGFLLRLYVFTYPPELQTDTVVYISQADAILKGGYVNFFPNGFPFIIALLKICFKSNYITAMQCMNVLFSTLVVYLVYSIAKKIFKVETIALLAALITALFPSQLNGVRWLMTEVPSTFLLLAAFLCYYKKNNWLCSLLLGIATVLRTEMLMILLLLVFFDIMRFKKFNFALLAGSVLPMVLVGSFCYLKTGEFALAGHSRFNTIIATTASGDYIDFEAPGKHPEITTNKEATKLYVDFLKKEPAQFFKNRFANLWTLWGFYNRATKGGPGTLARVVSGIGNFFLLFFGFIAWWLNRRSYDVFITIIPFIVVTGIHVVYFGAHRYVCPVEPFMIILSAWTINKYSPGFLTNQFYRFVALLQPRKV